MRSPRSTRPVDKRPWQRRSVAELRKAFEQDANPRAKSESETGSRLRVGAGPSGLLSAPLRSAATLGNPCANKNSGPVAARVEKRGGRVADLRQVFDGSTAPLAPFLPFVNKALHASPAKAQLTGPVTVTTTVARTTEVATTPSPSSCVPSSKDSAGAAKLVLGNTPVKHGIGTFEALSRSTTTLGTVISTPARGRHACSEATMQSKSKTDGVGGWGKLQLARGASIWRRISGSFDKGKAREVDADTDHQLLATTFAVTPSPPLPETGQGRHAVYPVSHNDRPQRRSRYPSSWGRSAARKKTRATGPVVTLSRSNAPPSFSWGRKAAAAAFGVSRELGRMGDGQTRPDEEEEELVVVVVSTPRCKLHHPRPERVVNVSFCQDERLHREESR